MNKIEIKTVDGSAPTYVWDNRGPSVLVFIDGIGMRPAIRDVGERIASAGYRVVMPDLFYRLGEYTAPNPKELFTNPEVRAAWRGRLTKVVTVDAMVRDSTAYLDLIGTPTACVGYCMGGRIAFVVAATYPDRVVAAAAFHPGDLVSDAPDSPHLLAPKIKAKLFIGGAREDPSFDDNAKATLERALTDAHVDHEMRTFDARHGWVPSDTPVHDPVQAELHYESLFALLKSVPLSS
jgi:carboxymethylenebutenolidase